MPSDPYAKYLTPPDGADPYAQYLTKPGAKAVSSQPSDMDYSNSPWSALGRTFESSATLGVGDLIRAAATGKKPSETAAQSSAAAASLPWYVRWPTEALGYGVGAANLLNPVSDVAEAGALGLGAGAGLARVAGTAAEGASAGAISHVAGSDDPGLVDTAGSALGGAALGGAAGAAAPLINKGLTKALGKAGTVDPQQAIDATEAIKKAKYAEVDSPQAPAFGLQPFSDAYVNASNSLTQFQKKDISKDFYDKMIEQQNEAAANGSVTTGFANYYANKLQDLASNPAETVLAARIRDNLLGENGMLAKEATVSGHPTGQAYQILKDANDANKQYEMAKNLAEWQRKAAAGADLGQAPLTEAERFYQGQPEYQSLVDLYKKNQSQQDPSWAMGHVAAGALGDLGGMVLGFPGHLGMEALAYLGVKPAIKGFYKGKKLNAVGRNIQQLYPPMTGQFPTGATTGPQLSQGTGEAIKNLTMALGGY